MTTQHKTIMTDFFDTHPEVVELLAARQQVVISGDDGQNEAVLMSFADYADYEARLYDDYIGRVAKRIEAEINDTDTKEYSSEDFFTMMKNKL